jgi:hypothetical protein
VSVPVLVRKGIDNLLPMQGRSNGIHVSNVINHICIQRGIYEDSELTDAHMTRLQLGCALEHAVIQRYQQDQPARYISLGEIAHQDTFGTPDLFDIWENRVHEIKLTWMSESIAADPTGKKFWKYWVQLKAYLKMLGLTTGVLEVCFVNGAYGFLQRPKIDTPPQFYAWEWEFTQGELDRNWAMIMNHVEPTAIELGMVKINGVWRYAEKGD